MQIAKLVCRRLKRIAKSLAIAAAALVVLLCAAGWLVNRWLQSPEGRAEMERKIGDALRLPVKIGTLAFSAPFIGVRASLGMAAARAAPSGVSGGSRPLDGFTTSEVCRCGLPYSRQCDRDSPKKASLAF